MLKLKKKFNYGHSKTEKNSMDIYDFVMKLKKKELINNDLLTQLRN